MVWTRKIVPWLRKGLKIGWKWKYQPRVKNKIEVTEMGKEEPKTTEIIIVLDTLVEIAGQNLQDWIINWIKEDPTFFPGVLPDDIEKVSVRNSFADNAGNVKLEIDFSGRKWFRDLDEINRCG